MREQRFYLLIVLIFASSLSGACDAIFNTKNDEDNAEIFAEGRIDPTLESEEGYALVQPVWTDFDAPTDVHVGFDEFVYVTDSEGLHILDLADLSPRLTIPLNGANAITQDHY